MFINAVINITFLLFESTGLNAHEPKKPKDIKFYTKGKYVLKALT